MKFAVLASLRTGLRTERAGQLFRLVLIGFFAWLTVRHWHPHYGFTRFLQCDPLVEAAMVPTLRDKPLYVHGDPGSYDGFYYAQIATDPGLRVPELKTAVDDLGYRARRILLSAVAWTIGLGEPIAGVRAYAWLNLVVWLALAALLWRLFPSAEWRGNVSWAGVMFAAGTLLSVRFALTDLAALALLTAAAIRVEQGRPGWAAGLIGLATLARETALLGIVTLLPIPDGSRHQRLRAFILCSVAVLPLAVWLLYVWTTVGSSGAGLRNFGWPLEGWLRKTGALFDAWQAGADRRLVLSSILGHAALTTQLVFLVLHASRSNTWWRIGAVYGVLMLTIGPAVWGDDLPGASVRVLLPLGLAFNVLAVRLQSSAPWLLLGNLSVVGGVLALWFVPHHAHEVGAGRFAKSTYVVRSGESWHAAELGRNEIWAWCPQSGELTIETWPRNSQPLHVNVALRGFTERDVEISAGKTVIWHGALTETAQWIKLPVQATSNGQLELQLRSAAPPGRESERAGGRSLGFAICGIRVEGPPE
jgi:hypothetical protein